MIHSCFSIFVAIVFASVVLASDSDRHVYESSKSVPSGWRLEGRAAANRRVKFFLALKQQNLDLLESKFWSVSDPNSAEYRQFLSINEINAIIAPSDENVNSIFNWLLFNGVNAHQIGIFSDAFEVKTTVVVAERLFQTEFYQFRHEQWGRSIFRQYGQISVPKFIHNIIDMVIGISNFPHYRPNRMHARPDGAPSDIGVVAQTTYGLYNIPSQSHQNASSITSQGVIEFDDEVFAPFDIQQYAKLVEIPITPLTADHIVGKNHGPGKAEATLDLEFIATVNVEAMNWFWIEDDNAWLYGFTTHFYNTTTVPQVVSISYGWWEGDQCSVAGTECSVLKLNDDAYVARVNTEFQKIALRGISILVSSGDSGAHTRSDPKCVAKTLRSEYPAGSPYVTSVGATQISDATPLSPQPPICTQTKMECAAKGTEVAVSFPVAGFTSGGGFSEVAAQPDYQAEAVKAYLNSGVKLPPAAMYNASNRAHPDVAAVGNNNLISVEGILMPSGGTSASAPIFAAIVALLNQASIAKTGKPLGFLNPLLYQIWANNPSAFNDITSGDNLCTEDGCSPLCKGWYATKGWDPVTGLGTPNYEVLLQEVNKLGEKREVPVAHC